MTGPSRYWNNERLTAVARQVCARYAGFDGAFVSGSLVEGFGNSTSDIDVFLLGDEIVTLEQSSASVTHEGYSIDVDIVDDVRTDVELWTSAAAAGALNGIADCDPTDWKAALLLDKGWIEFAHRLRIGLPVAGAIHVEALREKMDWAHLAAVLTQRFLYICNGHVDDAIGAVQAEDACAAMLNSRLALGAAADALAAAAGATNASAKWRHHRLAKYVSPETATRYLDAEIDTSSAAPDLLKGARSRLRLSSELASEATTRLLAYTNRTAYT